ncbi:unnamed protein product [Ambrosiozyma monospora]|uniref:Unnamed protein product n=1 Tax=Ambrosiozyma monospora TaxID=43982 RepID=A0ACB5ST30_AMBMO|nr:unnamed protein product [Ambrosiozyma monospora]
MFFDHRLSLNSNAWKVQNSQVPTNLKIIHLIQHLTNATMSEITKRRRLNPASTNTSETPHYNANQTSIAATTTPVFHDDHESADEDEPKDAYSWAKHHSDAAIYTMISQLPKKVQFSFFTILFHQTQDINHVVDMIDPRWYKNSWLRRRAPSSLQYLLRLLFKKVTAEVVYREGIVIHRFKGIDLSTPNYDKFLFYLEAFPPEYFNVIIRTLGNMERSSKKIVRRAIGTAGEIACNNDGSIHSSVNAGLLFPKMTRFVFRTGGCGSYHFYEKFTKVANIELELAYGKKHGNIQDVMKKITPLLSRDIMKMILVDIQLASLASFSKLLYEPELYSNVVDSLRNVNVPTEVKINSKTCIYDYHLTSSFQYLKELSFEEGVFENCIDFLRLVTVAEILNYCHSLN